MPSENEPRDGDAEASAGAGAEASAYYCELLKPVYRGKRFVVIGGPIAGLAGLADSFAKLGAEASFLLGSSIGTGPEPDSYAHPWHSFDQRSETVAEEFRLYEAALRDLPEGARAALDRFDPERRALGIGLIVLSDVPSLDGRARYARRPSQWAALEDKTAIEPFWRALGVRTAPSEVVAVERGALAGALDRLDRGAGCVVAGDSRSDTIGGAELTRPVRRASELGELVAALSPHCDRARVMPFLEGVPCSIHGIVLPDFVAVLRPVELVVLRRPDLSSFVYAGVGTFWDPPDPDRAAMRAFARRVGEALRQRVGYRGAFTVDGVLGEDGFLPTELNPRFGAGLGPIAAAAPALPLPALLLAIAHGEALDYRGEWLEETLVGAADERRSGRGSLRVRVVSERTRFQRVRTLQGAPRLVDDGEGDGTFTIGPGPLGSFFSYSPDRDALAAGSFLAPRVVDAFALADRVWETGIGAVAAARPVER